MQQTTPSHNPDQTPQDPEIKTPDRVLNAPNDTEIEVREYDITDVQRVIGQTAVDTHGRVTKLYRGEGPSPIPHTKNAKDLQRADLDKKMTIRSNDLAEKITKALEDKLESIILGELNSRENISEALNNIVKTEFPIKLSEFGIAVTHEDARQKYDSFQAQQGALERRSEFIEQTLKRIEKSMTEFFQTKMSNYGYHSVTIPSSKTGEKSMIRDFRISRRRNSDNQSDDQIFIFR